MMIKVYGIPNCNSVKKAITWLKDHNLEYEFHDFKKEGVNADQLKSWSAVFGWDQVLNKKGTTWRKLDPEQQQAVKDEDTAIEVMLANPSAIKRPVIVQDEQPVLLGYNEDLYFQKLKS
jgi:Spx/MgsR family transcriptional regulator